MVGKEFFVCFCKVICSVDEATSALDNESEQCILKVINKLKENAIVLMIAHRPSTIDIADQIIKI